MKAVLRNKHCRDVAVQQPLLVDYAIFTLNSYMPTSLTERRPSPSTACAFVMQDNRTGGEHTAPQIAQIAKRGDAGAVAGAE